MLFHPHFAGRRHDDLIAAAETPGCHRSREAANPTREPPRRCLEGLTLDHTTTPAKEEPCWQCSPTVPDGIYRLSGAPTHAVSPPSRSIRHAAAAPPQAQANADTADCAKIADAQSRMICAESPVQLTLPSAAPIRPFGAISQGGGTRRPFTHCDSNRLPCCR
jgi:hypothetical protein